MNKLRTFVMLRNWVDWVMGTSLLALSCVYAAGQEHLDFASLGSAKRLQAVWDTGCTPVAGSPIQSPVPVLPLRLPADRCSDTATAESQSQSQSPTLSSAHEDGGSERAPNPRGSVGDVLVAVRGMEARWRHTQIRSGLLLIFAESRACILH